MDFVGATQPLSAKGFEAASAALSIGAAELWTVMAVETNGCGFLPDRRPQILYERHLFSRLTGGRFDDGDISDPEAGGYGSSGAHQYDRLARAIVLDREAAVRSTSWGLGQVLGLNCVAAGFADVESMVAAMVESEDAHVLAMARFVKSTGLHLPLKSHDWTAFARGYNGKNFAKNQYDIKLAQTFTRLSAGNLPDLDVRAAQFYLTFLGFNPGPVDGIIGTRTRQALAQFRAQQTIPGDAAVDNTILARLSTVALA